LERVQVVCGTKVMPTATVKLKISDKEYIATAPGNGPIDAVIAAIDSMVKKKVTLDEYLVQAISGGSDDLGKVHIQLSYRGKLYYGFGSDTDIVVASAKAYIVALNQMNQI